MFLFASPARSADLAKKVLIFCTFLPIASGIEVTDEWVYHTTNAQTIIGAIGVLTMSLNFISGYYFYRKHQNKICYVIQQRIDELEEINNLKKQHHKKRDRSITALEQYMNERNNINYCEVIRID